MPIKPISLEDRQKHGKPLVLVVDDDPIHLKLLELLADRLDITVQLTSSCDQAIESLKTFSFDVVLMDCRMPDVDGYMCTQQIRAMNEKTKTVPIIAVTADILFGGREKCLACGMNDHLAKPFTLEELHEKLVYWLNRKME